ncbi:MAG: hypothetical protein ACK5ZC_16795 [Pirellulaceae bacterium]
MQPRTNILLDRPTASRLEKCPFSGGGVSRSNDRLSIFWMIRGTNYIRPPKRLGREIRNRPTGWNRRALQIKIDAACEVDTVGIQVGKAISLGHAIIIMALRQTRIAVFQGENARGRG